MIQRTPPYEESPEKVLQEPTAEYQTWQPFAESRPEQQSRHDTNPKKSKIKTKGEAKPSHHPVEPPAGPSSPPTALKQIAVDKRALKVFKTLFFVSSASSQPGEIPWTDFVHALVAVGFTAQKLYGSAWQFVPQGERAAGKPIQFHDPHPSNKLDFNVARGFGRSLNKHYGCNARVFVLE